MRTFFEVIVSLFLLYFFLNITQSVLGWQEKKEVGIKEVIQSVPIEEWRKDIFVNCNNSGKSNEPVYMEKACRFMMESPNNVPLSYYVGKAVNVICYHAKCSQDGSEEISLQKRVKKVKDNCIWIEGDNPKISYDSRYYGWLCGDDFFIPFVFLGTAEKYVFELD